MHIWIHIWNVDGYIYIFFYQVLWIHHYWADTHFRGVRWNQWTMNLNVQQMTNLFLGCIQTLTWGCIQTLTLGCIQTLTNPWNQISLKMQHFLNRRKLIPTKITESTVLWRKVYKYKARDFYEPESCFWQIEQRSLFLTYLALEGFLLINPVKFQHLSMYFQMKTFQRSGDSEKWWFIIKICFQSDWN